MDRNDLCVDKLKKNTIFQGLKSIYVWLHVPLNAWKLLWSQNEALQTEMRMITYVFNMEIITSPLSYTNKAQAICSSI